jgi:hypothetical protein
MIKKTSDGVEISLRLMKEFLVPTILLGCLCISASALAQDLNKEKTREESICERNSDKKLYVSQKSVKIYKGKLFVWCNNKLFSPKALHCDKNGVYILRDDLGSVLAKSISIGKSKEIKVICPRCGRPFKNYGELYDHLSEFPPCKER